MPLPQIPLDDPRVPALAKARQRFAHDYVPAVELIDGGWRGA
ncbi:hypothetical protein [Actinomadura sp. SCN-SB]